MTKKRWKIFLVFSISLVFIFLYLKKTSSCGYGWEGDYYYSIFDENIIHQPSLEPFLLSDYMYHPYTDSSFFDEKEINLKEWQNYFGNNIEKNDIEKVLYPTKKDDLLKLRNAIWMKNNIFLIDKWQNNSLVKYWGKNKFQNSLDYFIYAKEIEPLVEEYYWEIPKRDTALMLSLRDEGIKKYSQVDDNFLKLRYAFQAIRLSRYTNDLKETINLYDELVQKLNTSSIVKYWALSLKAGALRKSGQLAAADYLFAYIFNNCPALRFLASSSLNVSFNDSLINASLKLCMNNDEKAALLTLSVFKGAASSLDAMQQIYSLNSKSPYLELLLSREVKGVEREILPPRDYYGNYKSYLVENEYIDKESNRKLTEFVKQVADNKDALHPYIWYLSAGYLMTLNNENHDAPTYYYYARKSWPENDSAGIKNIKLFTVTNDFLATSLFDESNLLKDLSWLKNNNESAFIFARQKLAMLYAQRGDMLRMHLLLGDNDFNYDLTSSPNEEPVDLLIRFLEKPGKTEYEKFLANIYKYNLKELYDIKGTVFLGRHKFAEAVEAFDNGYGGKVLQADPFVVHINDCIDCDIRDKTSKEYTKKSFALRMLQLDSLAKSDKKNSAQYYFLMANGLYNISLFGNCWDAVSYYKNFDAWFHQDLKDVELYDCSEAQKYYLKGMNLSNDSELAAKCCFMASKCEQNSFYVDYAEGKIKIPRDDFWKNYGKAKLEYRKNFLIMRNNYSNTEFYKEALKECKYFNQFINNH